jgi:hypothetical protein
MTNDEAFANLQSALADYRGARESLDLHRGLAKHGIVNELAYAVHAEHSALYRLERVQAAYAALQPAAPVAKPTSVPKTVAATAPVKPPVPATKRVAPSYAEAKRDADFARDAYQAARKRLDEAHRAAVADAQARHAAKQS